MMFRINLKDETVHFKFICNEFYVLSKLIFRLYEQYDVIPTVTSACDGNHVPNSWHYKGLAWDWRIWGLSDPKRIANQLEHELQAIDYHYTVIYGDNGHKDHIHVEYDLDKKGMPI
jgi:hypothetical protein